jgi:hypothetical protein
MDYADIQNGRRAKMVVDKSNVSTLSKPKQTQIFLEAMETWTKYILCMYV